MDDALSKDNQSLFHVSMKTELLDILAEIIAYDILKKAERTIEEQKECLNP